MNEIEIGNGSGLGANFHLQNCSLVIGNHVMVAPNVMVPGGGHKFDRIDIPIGQQGNLPKSKLEICDDVWIGNRVIILGNVKRIGTGTIIGAGAVVTKPVPDYSVVAGNPAKIINIDNDENTDNIKKYISLNCNRVTPQVVDDFVKNGYSS